MRNGKPQSAWGCAVLRTACTTTTATTAATAATATATTSTADCPMAKSRYEYVRAFEQDDRLLLNCWNVIRIDGRSFHRFSSLHAFRKPNDVRALRLMNACAQAVLREFADVVIAFGQSDEFSFVLHKHSRLFRRRSSKIMSNIVSLFSSSYVLLWSEFMDGVPLQYAPVFDGRVVSYPTDENLRDYLSWRQVDCHINNLYNTCFWKLVLEGAETEIDAERILAGTVSAEKNELLFSRFGINYNKEEEQFRKGSIVLRLRLPESIDDADADADGGRKPKAKRRITVLHCDLIGQDFWDAHSHILHGKAI